MQGTLEKEKSAAGLGAKMLIVSILICVGGVTVWMKTQPPTTGVKTTTTEEKPIIKTVTALGRLEPQGEVIKLAAPSSSQGQRVERLLVKEGDRVRSGQIIAFMDSYSQRKAAEAQAQQQIEVAQAKLAAVKAGAKEGEIEAQRAEIARLESEREGNIEAQKAIVAKLKSELVNAETEFDRYNWLYEEGAVSASQRDSKQLVLDTTRNSLKEAQATLDRIRSSSKREINRAKATLDQITQVRPVDVEVAQAEVEQAVKAQEEARATLDQSIVRSPIDGEILYIHTRPGEVVASDGIVEIGQTRQMKVVAEVYQSDVGKVKPGQRVKVISEVMPEELTGTVERIASQVTRQNIVNTDPSANIDARVVEVHIKLDGVSSQKAAKFTNLQVKAVIGL